MFPHRKAKALHSIIAALIVTVTACSGSGESVVEIALHPTKPEILYIATNQYIYKTRNEGKTWANVSRGVTHSRVISLVIAAPFTLYHKQTAEWRHLN